MYVADVTKNGQKMMSFNLYFADELCQICCTDL